MTSFIFLTLALSAPPELKLPPYTVSEKWVRVLEQPRKDIPLLKSDTPADRIVRIVNPDSENSASIAEILNARSLLVIVKEPVYLPRPVPGFESPDQSQRRLQLAMIAAPDYYKNVRYQLDGLETKDMKAGQLIPIPLDGLLVETDKLQKSRGQSIMILRHDVKLLETFDREHQAREQARKNYEAAIAKDSADNKKKLSDEEHAKSILNAAKFYLETGRKEKAREQLDKLLKEYPTTKSAGEAKEILKKTQ